MYEDIVAIEDKWKIDLNSDVYDIHIAKTSCGWMPQFQESLKFKSVKDMELFYTLNSYKWDIIDEYCGIYTWDEFVERVLEFVGETSHLENNLCDDYYTDKEGYEFCRSDFR